MTVDRAAVAALVARPALQRLLAVLDGDGETTWIVGGAVRDVLIGRRVSDVDCATTATPEETMRRAGEAGFRVVPTGIDHGTVTVIVEGTPFEVTSLREDVETDGRRAKVAFGRDFAADARRRDFTMNALYADRTGQVHDFVGGLADLAARHVRFIGDPGQRIAEDYLRILRFFRFHAAYGAGDIDAAGFTASVRARAGLDLLSHERLRTEIAKLLGAARALETCRIMIDAGLLQRIFAGVTHDMRLARLVAWEAAFGRRPDPVLRLAALGTDIPEDAARLRDRLRLSNAETRRIHAFAALVARLNGTAGPWNLRDLRALALSFAPEIVAAAFAAAAPQADIDARGRDFLAAVARGEAIVPVFPLSGEEVVAAGVPKGPRVGAVLAAARERWLDEDCPADAAALKRILQQAVAAGRGG
ncbi:hypothetical protein AL346_02620 [Chelatococcus sp. CO-6]|uniref:CCA tRNA nucleotidyltransferase n=1 Tax=Chelatococcus sp. CO-6 TaxID=1702325 RepID=UPI00069D2623|nr:CCA tRNA nucleotidyltransferase [Chelatococcus sp. CO-6]ALA16501.1 hypothetical protein AL346_02620 [Chelatococcus sp. CO-6]